MKKWWISGLLLVTLFGCSNPTSSEESSSSYFSSSQSDISIASNETSSNTPSSEVIMQFSKAYIYAIPEGVNAYTEAEVYIGDTKVDIYAVKVNISQVWNGLAPNRVDNGYIVMELEGKMTVTVKTNYDLVPSDRVS